MKKLLVILLLFGTFISQSEAKIQAGIGITVGPCMGRWSNNYLKAKLSSAGGTLSYQVGVHAGIQARIWFNKFVGLNLAGEFNMGGNKFQRYVGPNYLTLDRRYHKDMQITIPLTAMVGWGNERLRVFFNGGGYFGYVVSATDRHTTSTSGSPEVGGPAVKADFKSDTALSPIDAGFRLGGGIQVYVDKKLKSCITFDVNLDFGMTKTFKGKFTPSYFNSPQKVTLTRTKIMIGVGYIYTFGKSQAEEQPKRGVTPEE